MTIFKPSEAFGKFIRDEKMNVESIIERFNKLPIDEQIAIAECFNTKLAENGRWVCTGHYVSVWFIARRISQYAYTV